MLLLLPFVIQSRRQSLSTSLKYYLGRFDRTDGDRHLFVKFEVYCIYVFMKRGRFDRTYDDENI